MIAFDFDDVISDLDSLLKKGIQKRTGITISQRKNYKIEIPGYESKQSDKIISEIIYDDCRLMDPIPRAIDNLNEIQKLIERDILIISARGKDVEKRTREWLEDHIKNRFPYMIKFSDRGSKINFFEKDIRFFVDDHPFFTHEASKLLEHVFLMHKPWNTDIYLRRNITRVQSLDTVTRFLKNTIKMENPKE